MMTPKQLVAELEQHLDGPHADEHTVAAADLAAEAIRFLCYATGSHSPDGVKRLSTVYEIAGAMQRIMYRMPQCFDQLAAWLARENAAGRFGMDDGHPPDDGVASAIDWLARAALLAQNLGGELGLLQSALSRLNRAGPNETGEA